LNVFFKQDVSSIFSYFSSKIKYFIRHNIKIVIVFDGKEHPLKRKTNKKRYELRAANKQKLLDFYEQGNIEMAKKFMPLSMSISPDMIKSLHDKIKNKF
jgi:exonuclease-1